MKRAVDLPAIEADLRKDCDDLMAELTADFTRPISERGEHAMARIQTFMAIALRVMRTTNPSRLRDAAMTEEIKARIAGRQVIEDD